MAWNLPVRSKEKTHRKTRNCGQTIRRYVREYMVNPLHFVLKITAHRINCRNKCRSLLNSGDLYVCLWPKKHSHWRVNIYKKKTVSRLGRRLDNNIALVDNFNNEPRLLWSLNERHRKTYLSSVYASGKVEVRLVVVALCSLCSVNCQNFTVICVAERFHVWIHIHMCMCVCKRQH